MNEIVLGTGAAIALCYFSVKLPIWLDLIDKTSSEAKKLVRLSNFLEVSEYDVFTVAYVLQQNLGYAWYLTESDKRSVEKSYSEYMRTETLPCFVKLFLRTAEEEDSAGTFRPSKYHSILNFHITA